MPAVEDVANDLYVLRRGAGVNDPDVMARLGGSLRAVVETLLDVEDTLASQRLSALLRSTTAELRSRREAEWFLACLGVTSQEPHLQDREATITTREGLAPRTIKRHVERTCREVASALLALSARAHQRRPGQMGGWFVDSLSSVAHLETRRPSLHGQYDMVAVVDGVQLLANRVSIPPPPRSRLDQAPHFEATEGADLVRVERLSASAWEYLVRLPHPLAAGEGARFGVAVTMPNPRYARPYNVLVPLRAYRHFHCEVHFGDDPEAEVAWRLDGLPAATAEDEEPLGETYDPRSEPVLKSDFFDLQTGCVYGIRWRLAEPHP